MRIAIFGDVMGRTGRRAVKAHLPELRDRLGLEFVIVNAENAAGGFGINQSTATELFDAGADVLTLGNHGFDQAEALTYLDQEPRIVRPANYPPSVMAPGRGAGLFDAPGGRRVMVTNLLGHLFMDALDDPFAVAERELAAAPLGEVADVVVVDMHAEATSEKNAMGVFCDGRASVVVGTHTHVPTADARVLPGGTAYITDLGMCGDYDSIIGMDKEEPMRRFTTRIRSGRMKAAEGEASLCGLFVETDDATGLALRCEPIRVAGELSETVPEVATEPAE